MSWACWGCRIAILAIVLIIIALAWEVVAASAALVQLAQALGVTAQVLTGVLAGIFGWSAAQITDFLCCKFMGVCCQNRS